MEALTISLSKFLAIKLRNGDFSSSSSRPLAPVFRFPISDNKNKNFDFLHSVSLRSRDSVPSSLSLSTITLAGVSNIDSISESTYGSNNVHVKIQLQRECAFGEHFYLVGDDPSIGIWDPANAIPLNWSDEHLWMVELDFPIGKSIRFKFILKGATEEVLWQPGPDRVFETWETKNTIVVTEDWENFESQNITEEPSSYPITVAEDISNVIPGGIDNNGFAIGEEFKMEKEHEILDNSFQGSLVAGNILAKNGIPGTEKKLASAENENIVDYVREHVLVPGLTPSVTRRSEEIDSAKAESNSELRASSVIDEDEDPGMSKPDEEEEEPEKKEADDSQNQEEDPITVSNDVRGQEQDSNELKENRKINTEHELAEGQVALQEALQNDFQWGRKTLSKFFKRSWDFL